MEIKTRYNIGDKVWFIENNHIVHSIIYGYCTSYAVGAFYGQFGTGDPQTSTSYHLIGGDMLERSVNMEEEELFPTKEELLKSLSYDTQRNRLRHLPVQKGETPLLHRQVY